MSAAVSSAQQNQNPPNVNPDLLPASFLPKSPTLAPFLRFDDQRNVDLITGAAQLAVPLVELTSGPLRLPVALGYSYTGLKVFQPQDLVGLGWSLQAGGSITRQINGLPDDFQSSHGAYTATSVLQPLANQDQRFFKAAVEQDVDVAPDIYSFSVDGYTGRFTIQSNTVTLLPAQPLRVERTSDDQFQITAETGVRYQFATQEITKPNANNFGRVGQHTSAWHLTRIISAAGTDTIRLHYSTPPQPYTEPAHCVLTTGQLFPGWSLVAFNPFCNCDNPYTLRNITPIPSQIKVQYLDSISTRGARITFRRQPTTHVLQQVRLLALSPAGRRNVKTFTLTHSFFPGLATASNQRLRLDQVQEQNGPSRIPAYRFRYEEGDMPAINSLALDYWGYYNGATDHTSQSPTIINNTESALLWDSRINTLGAEPNRIRDIAAHRTPAFSYAQRGALRQVTYPTGGTTTFEYEPGRHPVAPYYAKSGISLNVACSSRGPSTQPVICAGTFVLEKRAEAHLLMTREPSDASSGPGGVIINNGQTNKTRDFNLKLRRPNGSDSLITDLADDQYQLTDGAGRTREYDYRLPKGKYILEVWCDAYEFDNQVDIDLRYDSTLVRDGYGPGIRVRQTTTAAAGSPPLVQAYDYTLTDALGPYSSGRSLLPADPNGIPRFTENSLIVTRFVSDVIARCFFLNTSSEMDSLGTENYKYPFFYQRVTERRVGGTSGAGMTVSDFRAMPLLFNDVVLSRRRVYRQPTAQVLQLAQREDHTFYTGPTTVYHALRARQMAYTPPPATAPLDVYTADAYDIAAAFTAPQQTVQIRYDERGDSLVTTTISGYQDQHLVRVATRTSTDWKISRYKYLTDYAPYHAAVMALAGDKQDFNPVIENQTWHKAFTGNDSDSTLVGGHLTFYDAQWRSPVSSWSLRLDRPADRPDAERTNNLGGPAQNYTPFKSDSRYQPDDSVTYHPTTGLLVQRQAPHGPPTAYVWGYSHRYPIAQVENATYAQVLAVLTQATLDQLAGSNPGSDEQVRQALAPLRARLPQARVTVYTYQPLVGLTSQTDASGRTTFFEYDALGRLLRTRDEQNRLLTQQEYHYARP